MEGEKSAYQGYCFASMLGHKGLVAVPRKLVEKINPKRVAVKLVVGGF